jgi:hypothetical protein
MQQMAGRTTLVTNEVELTITARVGPQARPTQLVAIVNRDGASARVQAKLW